MISAKRSFVAQARALILVAAAVLLAGCETTGPMSIAGSECKIFERPPYAVRGVRQYDQNWIDSQVEGGIGACGWKRPAARPASMDAPAAAAARAAPAKRRGVVARIKAMVRPEPAPAAAPAAPVAEPAPAPASAPPRRSPLELLLDPSGPAVAMPGPAVAVPGPKAMDAR
jgi:hypothetical protein